MKYLFYSLLVIFIGAGCASELKPATLDADANPQAELKALDSQQNYLLQQQVEVFSPHNFTEFKKYYNQANDQSKSGASRENILKLIAMSKAYLQKATEVVAISTQKMPEVFNARKTALQSAGKKYPEKMDKIDGNLKDETTKLESGESLDPAVVTSLQQSYLDLDLNAIKDEKLSDAKNTLTMAEKQNAKKIVPQSFALAQQKYNAAEKTIALDRTNTTAIDKSCSEANMAAHKVLMLLNDVKKAKGQSSEQAAMDVETAKSSMLAADKATAVAIASGDEKDQRIEDQKESLMDARSENNDLKSKASFDSNIEKARKSFTKDQADVYRQGNNLIIRLKSIEFASGRSDLPAKSLEVLNKVKNVIEDLSMDQVVIEGHTDGVGNAQKNKLLSEKRAESVKEFFVSNKSINVDHIKSVGYGFEKPLATNKTPQGRAQNRRVDIVITPQTSVE